MSTPPSASEGMVLAWKPAIVQVAGLVPWAESGTRTTRRLASPRDSW